MNKQNVAILGAGEMGLQALHYLILMNGDNEHSFTMSGWFDDTKIIGEEINGYRVLGGTNDIFNCYKRHYFDALFIAIGYKHLNIKKILINKIKPKIPLINIIARNTYIDETARLGCNIMLYPGAIVDKGAIIDDGVILNLGSIVSHNSQIGGSTFLAPGTTIAGFTNIGECCFLGASTTVIDNLSICDNVLTGAGAVVTRNIVVAGTYLGIPAKLHS